MKRSMQFANVVRIFAVAAFGVCLVPALANAQEMNHNGKSFAQKLVEQTHAQHPEATEIGIVTVSARGCRTIASTDSKDIGEKCEAEDSAPMKTGKPYVEKEKDGYDISLPLHDAAGKVIGAVGIEFKLEAGQTAANMTEKAEQIAGEMEKQIPSKAALSKPAM